MEQKDKIVAAKRLINDEGIMKLLNEYMLSVEEQVNPLVMSGYTDEHLGQITRANVTAEQKIRERFGKIKNLVQSPSPPKPAAKS